jgi:hypothetical protein
MGLFCSRKSHEVVQAVLEVNISLLKVILDKKPMEILKLMY